MFDSDGLLSVLDRARRPRQARWVPVLETSALARRENKQESYWPVSVTAQHLHAVILKGEEKHPQLPVPLFQEIDLQLPLLRLENQQGQLEEKWVQYRTRSRACTDSDLMTDTCVKSCLSGIVKTASHQTISSKRRLCHARRLKRTSRC